MNENKDLDLACVDNAVIPRHRQSALLISLSGLIDKKVASLGDVFSPNSYILSMAELTSFGIKNGDILIMSIIDELIPIT